MGLQSRAVLAIGKSADADQISPPPAHVLRASESAPQQPRGRLQAIIVNGIVVTVVLLVLLINRQSVHRVVTGRLKQAAGGGTGDAVADAAPADGCPDMRRASECKRWAGSKKTFEDVGLCQLTIADPDLKKYLKPCNINASNPDSALLYACNGANKNFMKMACRSTCGECTEEERRQAPKARAAERAVQPGRPSGEGRSLLGPMLFIKPIVKESAWPLLRTFFEYHAATFRVFLDHACKFNGPQNAGQPGAAPCEYYWKIKVWNCRAHGTVGSTLPSHANALFNGWENPQCEKPTPPGEYRKPQIISSTSDIAWHQKFAAEAYVPYMLSKSPWHTKERSEANATVAVMWCACLREDPQFSVTAKCLQSIQKSPAYKANGGRNWFFILTTDYGER